MSSFCIPIVCARLPISLPTWLKDRLPLFVLRRLTAMLALQAPQTKRVSKGLPTPMDRYVVQYKPYRVDVA